MTLAEKTIDISRDMAADYIEEKNGVTILGAHKNNGTEDNTDAQLSYIVEDANNASVAMYAGRKDGRGLEGQEAGVGVSLEDGKGKVVISGDTTIQGVKMIRYISGKNDWAAGTHETINTSSKAFFDALRYTDESGNVKLKQIIGMTGTFTNDTTFYPLASPMMNESGSYAAAWGVRVSLQPARNAIRVTTGSTWTQYYYTLTVFYID